MKIINLAVILMVFFISLNSRADSICDLFLFDFDKYNHFLVETAHFTRVITKYDGQLTNNNFYAIENQPSMNCHGYSCFTNDIYDEFNEWIELKPFNLILQNHFQKIKTLNSKTVTKTNLSQLQSDSDLKHNDIVVFLTYNGERFHSGILVFKLDISGEQKMWVRSKFGMMPTYDLSVEYVHLIYPYPYTGIEIWRKK